MLTISKLTDLIAGKLSDQIAYEYLLEMSNEKPHAVVLNDLIHCIIEINQENWHKTTLDQFSLQADIIDCCGTGGSGIIHYNTSTSVAFILAAGGLRVAKFGNRAARGVSGSFDFLEYLALPIISSAQGLLEVLQATNLCFPYAPDFYPSLAKLAPLRKSLNKPTLFNLAGPLLNPFSPSFRLLGTPKVEGQKAIADYLFLQQVCKQALIVRAESGLDELDPNTNNEIVSVDHLSVKSCFLNLATEKNINANRQDWCLQEETTSKSVKFGTAEENANLFKELIKGSLPALHNISASVTLNAGAGFFIASKSSSIEEGQKLAYELLSSGAVLAKYEQCRNIYAKYTR